jgi:uncharacterized protein (TIGR00369 family)
VTPDSLLTHTPREVPEGFTRILLEKSFASANGPMFWREDPADGGVRFGMFIDERHCNPIGKCHGGWIATFFDMVLPLTGRFTIPDFEERFLLTVNLNIDYLAPVEKGDWLEGKGRVLKRTKRLVFVDGVLSVEGTVVARANTVLRSGPEGRRLR